MPQSSIGPGISIYSEYDVMESDDSKMSLKTALQIINRELNEERLDFDEITSFAISWFKEFYFSEKDFSFLFEKEQNLYEVQRYVKGLDKNLIKNVEFFDLYVAKDLGDDSKSVTFRVTIQSKEKTLEEKDLEQLHKNILEKVSNKFKAKIRS